MSTKNNCESLRTEYNNLIDSLNNDDRDYFMKSDVSHIKGGVGTQHYLWKNTDNITLYRRYDEIYKITKTGGYNAPLEIVKLPVQNEVHIRGLYNCM